MIVKIFVAYSTKGTHVDNIVDVDRCLLLPQGEILGKLLTLRLCIFALGQLFTACEHGSRL